MIHIGIIQDDIGRFSAQLQSHFLHRIGGHFHDFPPDFRTACNGDFVHFRMRAQELAHRSARAGKNIDDALGNARRLCRLGNDQCSKRCRKCRLQDDLFPMMIAWPIFQKAMTGGEVPGDNAHADTDGFPANPFPCRGENDCPE